MQPMPDALGGSGALFCTMRLESNLFKSFFIQYCLQSSVLTYLFFIFVICKGPWYYFVNSSTNTQTQFNCSPWYISGEIQGLNTSRGLQWCWEGGNTVIHRTTFCIPLRIVPHMLKKGKSKIPGCTESWDSSVYMDKKFKALLEVLFNNS